MYYYSIFQRLFKLFPDIVLKKARKNTPATGTASILPPSVSSKQYSMIYTQLAGKNSLRGQARFAHERRAHVPP